ncbi:MAG: hypothetical protein Q9207_004346 [Kuettlingeria erythrocarpa]
MTEQLSETEQNIKSSLADEIPSMAWNSHRERAVLTNSLAQNLLDENTLVLEELRSVKADIVLMKAEIARGKEEAIRTNDLVASLQMEANGYFHIRRRFFDVFQRSILGQVQFNNTAIIREGNRIAHAGDFKMKQSHDFNAITTTTDTSSSNVQLTSFGGAITEDDFRCRNQLIRAAHVSIWPCDPHPDTSLLLLLRHGTELRKNSYGKIDRNFEASWEMLGAYDETRREIMSMHDSLEVVEDAMKMWFSGSIFVQCLRGSRPKSTRSR